MSKTNLDQQYRKALAASHDEGIMRKITAAMQEAEEIGGPEGQDYIDLMEKIIKEARARISTFKKMQPQKNRLR
jgi:hypothetical protein